MRKLLYSTLVGLGALAIASCDETPKNPGDFSIKSELQLGDCLTSLTTGHSYPLKVMREVDTTYAYTHTLYDTLKYDDGEPILDGSGKLQVTERDTIILSEITAKLIEFEELLIPSYEDVELDTLQLELQSNTYWFANETKELQAVTWFNHLENQNKTVKGGGDGYFRFSTKRFANEVSKHHATQDIITKDSTTLLRVHFGHTGLKYTGN